MHERPQNALFEAVRINEPRSRKGWIRKLLEPRLNALIGDPRDSEFFPSLRTLGYRIDSSNGKLPAVIFGTGPKFKAKCTVSIEESSQFASALLLCAKIGGWKVEIVGENAEESPYVAMTSKMIEAFPHRGGKFQIEPDASSGSYFFGAMMLAPGSKGRWQINKIGQVELDTESDITLRYNPNTEWQIDEAFPQVFVRALQGKLPVSRAKNIGDSIMTAIVLGAYLGKVELKFTDLGRLRVQETERVKALFNELKKCGSDVYEDEQRDMLITRPSQLHGAEIETYDDHRMAMCFAILGLKVPGIKIQNPACVKKTFPNFFQKLAAPPPKGLGAAILDAKTGRKLAVEELFAE